MLEHRLGDAQTIDPGASPPGPVSAPSTSSGAKRGPGRLLLCGHLQGEETPRNVEFLFSRNRLNAAISCSLPGSLHLQARASSASAPPQSSRCGWSILHADSPRWLLQLRPFSSRFEGKCREPTFGSTGGLAHHHASQPELSRKGWPEWLGAFPHFLPRRGAFCCWGQTASFR